MAIGHWRGLGLVLLPFALGAACAPPADGPAFCLVGVVTAPDRHVAVIATAGTPSLQHLSAGAVVAGWTIDQIAPRAITVSQDDNHRRLEVGGATTDVAPAEIAEGPQLPPPPSLVVPRSAGQIANLKGWARKADGG